ncbi:FAD-dependent oxidoreductase [bacterium]|nr:FAD-dependent oxidoreductase [bacterium]
MSEAKRFDAIILGAGPAGLSAGIYLSRAKKSVVILDTGIAGGAPILTTEIANYPGVKDALGYELAFIMKDQATTFGCEIVDNVEISSLSLKDEQKEVVTDEGTFVAPVVIIATGGVPRTLNISGEKEFNSRGISYCATCDGDFFTGKDIVVVGGGNSALEEAVALTAYASSVTILHEFDHFQAFKSAIVDAEKNEKIQFIMDCKIESFEGDESLKGVKISDNKTGQSRVVPVTGAFIFIGYLPNSALFKDVVTLSEREEIVADEAMNTGVSGLFVAGDVRQKRYRQVTTAVADGTIAALSALEFIER